MPSSKIDRAERMKLKGNDLFKRGEYLAAIKFYKKVLTLLDEEEDDPFNFDFSDDDERLSKKLAQDCHLNLAFSYLKTEEFIQCIRHCNQILEVSTHVKALYRRGEAYLARGEYAMAKEDFKEMKNVDQSVEAAEKADRGLLECRTRSLGGLAGLPNPDVISDGLIPKVRGGKILQLGEKMILWGGLEVMRLGNCWMEAFSRRNHEFLYIYWPEVKHWFCYHTQGVAPVPSKSFGSAAILFDNDRKLAVFGGGGEPQFSSAELFILDLVSLQWSIRYPYEGLAILTTFEKEFLKGGDPTGRTELSGWLFEKKLWYFGGHIKSFAAVDNGKNLDKTLTNSLLCYDPVKHRWLKTNPKGRIPTPRKGHSTTDIGNGCILLFGGFSGCSALSDLHLLDMNTLEWSTVEAKGKSRPAGRWDHVAVKLDKEKLFIHGGMGKGKNVLSDAWLLDTNKWEWTKVKNFECGPRWGHTAVCISGRVYIHGGSRYGAKDAAMYCCIYKKSRYEGVAVYEARQNPKKLRSLALSAVKEHFPDEALPLDKIGALVKLARHKEGKQVEREVASLGKLTDLRNF